MLTPGILALQGGFDAHSRSMERLGVKPTLVRTLDELEGVDSLIIPGGESTVMIRLLKRLELLYPLKNRIRGGLPVFGTCAGMILLSAGIDGMEQDTLGVMDFRVQRNSYGTQVDSFESYLRWELAVAGRTDNALPAVFIRAPRITELENRVEVLMKYEESPVLVQQGNLLAASFHPELSDSLEIHHYFLETMAGHVSNE